MIALPKEGMKVKVTNSGCCDCDGAEVETHGEIIFVEDNQHILVRYGFNIELWQCCNCLAEVF